ncbi:hypothetical protein BGZ70_010399 [Mortierella alpina]|uniref:Uncharacterized protein n=1 Tax=Mortierella alpina TaxID=64518 RepID=A0A9P6J187_MORAP|nr:hypothetical protein BGZ70_010399 [Mortierella alpina]
MSKATIERRAVGILYDFQKSRKVWGDLVSDGLTQANALVNVQLQQGYVDSPGYWPPALDQFLDLKDRFESKLQKKADALAMDFEITFSKMSAQYAKMKLQSSQFEYLMEEATETFGELFTYREPLGSTCTLEQIWIQIEIVFGLYTQQIALNREILDQLVARNQHLHPIFTSATKDQSTQRTSTIPSESHEESNMGSVIGVIPPKRRDKDQGMILLSAWLNQPHLKPDVLASFDEFLAIATVLLKPVVYSLTIKTESSPNDLPTVEDIPIYQACIDICSKDIITDLTKQYEHYGLHRPDCANLDGFTVNETSPCVNNTEAFDEASLAVKPISVATGKLNHTVVDPRAVKPKSIPQYKNAVNVLA